MAENDNYVPKGGQAEMTKQHVLGIPPKGLATSLGLAQQSWHMADAACQALGLRFRDTSPAEIFDAVVALKAEVSRLEDVIHPWYGPCDGLGEDGGCSECQSVEVTRKDR